MGGSSSACIPYVFEYSPFEHFSVYYIRNLLEHATMTGVDVQPVAAFSLLMRLCFELRPVDNVRGSNIPILMILHVVLQLRSLTGVRSESNTNALVLFLTSSFSATSIDGVHALLRDALKVNAEAVDVADRVAVRYSETHYAHRVGPAFRTARVFCHAWVLSSLD